MLNLAEVLVPDSLLQQQVVVLVDLVFGEAPVVDVVDAILLHRQQQQQATAAVQVLLLAAAGA